jgi:serine/threonine protein kinase
MLTAGTGLGPYEIVAPLGAGGMGEVYRAHDPRLGRDVAIKVLPAAFADDSERLRRFEQEARAAAGLNHPNIVTIHSIEEAEGHIFDGQPVVREADQCRTVTQVAQRQSAVAVRVRREGIAYR